MENIKGKRMINKQWFGKMGFLNNDTRAWYLFNKTIIHLSQKSGLIAILLSILIGINSTSTAQVTGTIDYGYFYDDNPLRQNDGSEEFVNSVRSRLDFQPLLKSELFLFYSGGYNGFKNIADRNYQHHSFGVNYAFSLTDTTEKNFFIGANYGLKKGTSDYSIYDFTLFSAFANRIINISEDMILKLGYRFSQKNFSQLYNLTYLENLGTMHLSKFFETKTGLFLEAGLGSKNYSTTQVINTILNTSGTQKGKGKNRMSFITEENQINVLQLRTMLKASQSIFEKTGVSAYYLNRINLNDVKQNFQSTDFIYSDDSDLWDDPYGFESNEFGIELTQMLPYNFIAKVSGDFSRRRYLNNAADSLNLTQRLDSKSEIWAGLSKTFNSVLFLESIEIGLEYMFINNKSNASLFNYRNNLSQLSLQITF